MADFKRIITAVPNAASNTSLTSSFTVPGEFSHFAVLIPASSGWCVTTTVHVSVQGSVDNTTFYDVGYSQNPATATSSFALWETVNSHAVSGALVICEAMQFTPYAKLRFSNTATAAANFYVLGRKFD